MQIIEEKDLQTNPNLTEVAKSRRKRKSINYRLPSTKKLVLIGGVLLTLLTLLTLSYLYRGNYIFKIKEVNLAGYNNESEATDSEGTTLVITFDQNKTLQEELLNKYENSNALFFSEEDAEAYIRNNFRYIKEVKVNSNRFNRLQVELEEVVPELYMQFTDNCVLTTYERMILEKYETAEECAVLKEKYNSLPVVENNALKESFEVGEASSYFNIEKFIAVSRVFSASDLEVDKMVFEENILTVYVNQNSEIKEFVFSFNVDFDIQMKRFLIILNELNIAPRPYSKIDFRYEKPVLTSVE